MGQLCKYPKISGVFHNLANLGIYKGPPTWTPNHRMRKQRPHCRGRVRRRCCDVPARPPPPSSHTSTTAPHHVVLLVLGFNDNFMLDITFYTVSEIVLSKLECNSYLRVHAHASEYVLWHHNTIYSVQSYVYNSTTSGRFVCFMILCQFYVEYNLPHYSRNV